MRGSLRPVARINRSLAIAISATTRSDRRRSVRSMGTTVFIVHSSLSRFISPPFEVSELEFDGALEHITPGQPKLAGLHLRIQGPPDRDDQSADRTAQHASLDVPTGF